MLFRLFDFKGDTKKRFRGEGLGLRELLKDIAKDSLKP